MVIGVARWTNGGKPGSYSDCVCWAVCMMWVPGVSITQPAVTGRPDESMTLPASGAAFIGTGSMYRGPGRRLRGGHPLEAHRPRQRLGRLVGHRLVGERVQQRDLLGAVERRA